MNSRITTVMTCAGLLMIGCASAPPQELLDARAAYKRAAASPAADLNPAQLHVAKQTLALAEQVHEDEGKSFRARDRAYVAMRKAQLAEVQARILQAEQESAKWRHQAEMSEARMISRAREQAGKAKEELASEREARLEAEKRAQELATRLGKQATVSQDQRGTVIAMSGALMFQTGKSRLKPQARRSLGQVATMLKQTDPQAKILVEGHTDSTGSDEVNQRLSRERADSVRDFLVSRGVSASRIETEGYGSSRPIADNSTSEGRAANRRVEIVMMSRGGQQSEQPQQQQMQEQQPGMNQQQMEQQRMQQQQRMQHEQHQQPRQPQQQMQEQQRRQHK